MPKQTFTQFMRKEFNGVLQRSVQESVAQLDADLKDASPVDQGRFRASWFHEQSRGSMPDTDEFVDKPEKGQTVPPPEKLDPDSLDGLANHIVINNLPYATRLCEEGWSNQVDGDWFKAISQRWESGKYLDEAFRENMP